MHVVRTVDEKTNELKQRQDEQRRLGKTIDRLIEQSHASHDVGCTEQGLCPTIARSVARAMGLSRRQTSVSTKEVDVVVASEKRESATLPQGSQISRAVLGLAPSKKKTAHSKLAAVSDSMRARIASLEHRASECRLSAQASMKAGNTAAAMRDLKRAKMLEKQATSTQGAMDALEAQSDMLEQTALQKEVAAALGATAKSLKKEKGLLSKTEDAIDAAVEMRDMHEDLTQAMAGLGDAVSNDIDEDELMMELNGMLVEQNEDATPVSTVNETRTEYENTESIRPQFPSAPKGLVEKQSLLAHSQ